MRVLHITNAYPYPAVPEYGIFVKEQIDALRRAGLHCDVAFINGRAEGKSAYLSAIRTLRAKAVGYDVVHCHHLYSGLVAMLARVKAPIVLSFQSDWLRDGDTGSRIAQLALNSLGVWYADRVIFKGPIPPQFQSRPKFVHLPNGVNHGAFSITDRTAARARLDLDPTARYALFVSSKDQFRPEKRYDRFHDALNLARARRPEWDLRELVMVNQPREKVSDFFNAADLHVLCSDFEGSPNSVKEALCTGLPVVATNVGNVSDMLGGVPGCHVAPTGEPAVLASLIEELLEAVPEREAVRDSFLRKGLGQEQATARLIALYADAAAR